MTYEAIVIGVSAGGMNVMKQLFAALPHNFQLPIIIISHIGARSDNQWIHILNNTCSLTIKEADEKEKIRPGFIYFPPPNYHLMIENDKTFSLTIDAKVNYARPSIDVLFESAADAYGRHLIGIILTGSNSDGTLGLQRIKDQGGLTIVQDPSDAEYNPMPKSATSIKPDHILPFKEILLFLTNLNQALLNT
ncbi:MAG: chemotaxis protein CheB [Bacteroidota bacterium]|jgi:two-component system chemotaxis response regulator CheB|nr:chemotaxis protein CheB [Bacteroidota bacterium]